MQKWQLIEALKTFVTNQSDRQTKQFNMIASARSAVDMAAMTGNADDKAEAASQIADIERSVTGRSRLYNASSKNGRSRGRSQLTLC